MKTCLARILLILTAALTTAPPGHTAELCPTATSFYAGRVLNAWGEGYSAVLLTGTVSVDYVFPWVGDLGRTYYNVQVTLLDMDVFDTTVFGNYDYSQFSTWVDTALSFDTALVEEQITYSGIAGPGNIATGDTLRNVFLMQEHGADSSRRWHGLDGVCSYLSGEVPGYPVSEALGQLNRYVESTGMYRGYEPPPGDLRLGPVYSFVYGDPGWRLRAYADGSCWMFEYRVGDGDCPMSCTYFATLEYRVCADGSVEEVDRQCTVSTLCDRLAVSNRPAHRTRLKAIDGGVDYDLLGRSIDGPRQGCLAGVRISVLGGHTKARVLLGR